MRLTGCPGDAAAAAGAPKPVLAGVAPNADPGVPNGDPAAEPGVPKAGELEAAPNAGVLAAPNPPKAGALDAAPNAGVLAAAPKAGVLAAPKAPKPPELCAGCPNAGCREQEQHANKYTSENECRSCRAWVATAGHAHVLPSANP